MISSMTGFGEASTEVGGLAYAVEVRTVNNRYLKTQIRLPDVAAFLETPIEKRLRAAVIRGTVNYTLRMRSTSAQAFFEVDTPTLQAYLAQLSQLKAPEPLAGLASLDLAGLLGLPGVVQPAEPDEALAEQMRSTVLELTDRALEQLRTMRAEEGRLLAADLLANCDVMAQVLDLIRQRRPVVVQQYRQRLQRRVDELLAEAKTQIDADLLAREVALFADRSDIAEELTRLDSHLQQFRAECETDDKAGRKLDFICQEMLREANTIASKAGDAQISQWVIDIKCAIDRLKEQVQNVE